MVILAEGNGSVGTSSSLIGVVMVLLGATGSALQCVLLRRAFPGGVNPEKILVLLGTMGCINFVLMMPGMVWYVAKGQVVVWACAVIFAKGARCFPPACSIPTTMHAGCITVAVWPT
jgi:drug/metabolite transporter (DMT)-like permease